MSVCYPLETIQEDQFFKGPVAMQHETALAALEFYRDAGVDLCIADSPVDRFSLVPELPKAVLPLQKTVLPQNENQEPILGASQAREESVKLAKAANSLDELRDAIAGFDGISIKKTATNLVFSDGNPQADIMLIGEAPGADEDRQGKPFVGESGHLLDKILSCINLSRTAQDAGKSVYIANILNWRPPGNRTPNSAEIEVSLPFIERQIQLVNPKLIILCGSFSAKALLGSGDSISKLRRSGWHDYVPQTTELKAESTPIPAICTYHPAYLLRTPLQKKAVWEDMLKIQERKKTL